MPRKNRPELRPGRLSVSTVHAAKPADEFGPAVWPHSPRLREARSTQRGITGVRRSGRPNALNSSKHMSSRSSMAPAGSAVRGSSMYGSSALARPTTSRPASAPIRAPTASASFGDATSNRRAAEARIQEETARARQHRAARAVAARYQQRPPRPSSAREPRHYERPLSGRPASARREVARSARAERERRLCGGAVAVTSAPSPAALTREEQALLHRAPAPAPSVPSGSVPLAPAAPAPAPAPPARPQSAHQAWASPREPPRVPPAPPAPPQSARQASDNPHRPPTATVVDPFKVRIRVV
jgi:hypothetical protein